MKWLFVALFGILVFGILVFGIVGMTALDKYDERSCRKNPKLVSTRPNPDYKPPPWEVGEVVEDPTINVYETCDGFLPW